MHERAYIEAVLGNILSRQHALHAGQCPRLGDINALDPGVWVHASYKATVQHVRQCNVGGVSRLAANFVEDIVARQAAANVAVTDD